MRIFDCHRASRRRLEIPRRRAIILPRLYGKKIKNGEKENNMESYKNEKQNMIAKRERYRTLLQIKNLATTMRCLKEDIEKDRGVGLSLPAVENVAGKLGTAARAYQTARFTEEGWNVDKTDEGLNKKELHDQIMQIRDELEEIPYDLKDRIQDREPEKYPDQDQHEKYEREATDIDQETEEIEAIETELKKETKTKTW